MEEKTLKIGGGKPEAFLVCDKSLAAKRHSSSGCRARASPSEVTTVITGVGGYI